MTINPQTERGRRSRRLKGLVAGAAGVALLLGGSTFALWSSSDTIEDGATVKHGELKVVAQDGSATAYDLEGNDTTSPVTGNGGTVLTTSYLASPGAKLEIDLPAVKVEAAGDYLKYDLTVEPTTTMIANATSGALNGWTFTAAIYDSEGYEVGVGSVGIDLTGTSATSIVEDAVGDETYTVVLYADFDADNENHQSTTASITSSSPSLITDFAGGFKLKATQQAH
ncbi:MAG: SipW-dependent-type signal peptide-containing protein [Bifidobacteriaceae bacterium]|jgi:alternate signal-mediated exported protein|nr:SipW-dependent-type signal peptide-containing protein [Bifidobacteriaceae bacterium]